MFNISLCMYVWLYVLIRGNNKKMWGVCVCVRVCVCDGERLRGCVGFGFKANEPLMFLQ